MRDDGWTFDEIGEHFGWSMEMVRREIRLHRPMDGRKSRNSAERVQLAADVAEWLYAQPHAVARSKIRETFDITEEELVTLLGVSDSPIPGYLILASPRENQTDETFTDREVVEAIRRAWKRYKKAEPWATGLSHVQYDKDRDPDDICASRITSRIGWSEACNRAGVPSGGDLRPKNTYQSKWDDEQLFGYVKEYVDGCRNDQVRPTYTGFDGWLKDLPGAPSGSMFRIRMQRRGLNHWADVIETAYRGG